MDWLAGSRLGPDPFLAFVADLTSGALTVVDLVRGDYIRAGELLDSYRDMKLGFVDAAVVTIAERLQEPTIATLDRRHFAAVRPAHIQALEVVP